MKLNRGLALLSLSVLPFLTTGCPNTYYRVNGIHYRHYQPYSTHRPFVEKHYHHHHKPLVIIPPRHYPHSRQFSPPKPTPRRIPRTTPKPRITPRSSPRTSPRTTPRNFRNPVFRGQRGFRR